MGREGAIPTLALPCASLGLGEGDCERARKGEEMRRGGVR